MFLPVFAAMLENSCESTSSKRANALLSLWSLSVIMVTNGYRSFVTNELTAPLISNVPSSLDNMTNQEFRFVNFYSAQYATESLSEISSYILNELSISIVIKEAFEKLDPNFELHNFRSKFQAVFMYRYCFFDYGQRRKIPRLSRCNRPEQAADFTFHKAYLNTVYDKVKDYPLFQTLFNLDSYNVQDGARLLADCKKSALVTWSDDIEETIERVLSKKSHLKRKSYKILKETYLSRRKYLVISKYGWNFVGGGIHKILESGIYWKWTNFFAQLNIAHYKRGYSSGGSGIQGQELSSNIGTIFIVLLFGGAISWGVFVGEIVRTIWKKRRTRRVKIGVNFIYVS